MMSAEHPSSGRHLAARKRSSDRCGGNRLDLAVRPRQELNAFNLEILLGPECLEHVDISRPVSAEVEIVANDDGTRFQTTHKHPQDKLFCGLSGSFVVEGHDDDGVYPTRFEQLELERYVGQELWRTIRSKNLRRVGIEGDDGHLYAKGFAGLLGRPDHCLVSEMHPVIRANSERMALAGFGAGVRIANDLHG